MKGEEANPTGKNYRKRIQGFVGGCSLGITMRKCTASHPEVISFSNDQEPKAVERLHCSETH